MRLFLILTFFFLFCSEVRGEYTDFSCFEKDEKGEHTKFENYQKKIDASKETYASIKKERNYGLLINELTEISYCYEYLGKSKEFIKLINGLIDEKIISHEIFNYKNATKISLSMMLPRYGNNASYQTKEKYSKSNWDYQKKLINIFINKPEYYEQLFNFFIFQKFSNWRDPAFIKEYNSLLKKIIDQTIKKNEHANFLKFSNVYLQFNLVVDFKTCTNYYLNTYLNNENIFIPEEIEIFTYNIADGLHCVSKSGTEQYYKIMNNFISIHLNIMPKINNLILNAEKIFKYDEFKTNPKKILAQKAFNKFDYIMGIIALNDLKNRKLALLNIMSGMYEEQRNQLEAEKLIKLFNESNSFYFKGKVPFVYLKKNLFTIQKLIQNKKYFKAEELILSSLKDIRKLTFQDVVKMTYYDFYSHLSSDYAFEDEKIRLEDNYLLEYTKILDFSGRHVQSIQLKEKIIGNLNVLRMKKLYKIIDDEYLYSTKEYQFQLPSLYSSITKTLVKLQDFDSANTYFAKWDKLCTKIKSIWCEILIEDRFEFYITVKQKKYFKKAETNFAKLKDLYGYQINFLKKDYKNYLKMKLLTKEAQFYLMASDLNINNQSNEFNKKTCEINKEIKKIVRENNNIFSKEEKLGVLFAITGCLMQQPYDTNDLKVQKEQKLYFESIEDFMDEYKRDLIKWSKFGYLNKADITTDHGFMLASLLSYLKDDELYSKNIQKKYKHLEEKVFQLIQYEMGNYRIKSQKKLVNKTKNDELIKLLNERDNLENELEKMIKATFSIQNYSKPSYLENKQNIEEQISNINNKIKLNYKDYVKENEAKNYNFLDIQKKLEKDDAFLFISNQKGVLVVLVTKNNVNIYSDPRLTKKPYLINDSIEGARKSITSIKEETYLMDLNFLYKIIFKPLEANLANVKNLNIVTDKYFSSFPLEMLITNGQIDEGGNFIPNSENNYDYLINDYNVSYFPSIAAFVELDEGEKTLTASSNFLGIGNPEFKINDKNLTTKFENISEIYLNRRGFISNSKIINEKYPEIPFTETELNAISHLFKKSKVLVGSKANEGEIKNINFENYSVVAFATHAEVAGTFDNFNEPFIVLTPPEIGTEFNDGLVTSSEISELNLNVNLIILSACNTASKENKYAVGFSGLINSFFIAGANSVIATHWPVADEAGYLLMSETMKKIISQKKSKAEALRMTKLEFIEGKYGEEYKHPFFWASYILVGN